MVSPEPTWPAADVVDPRDALRYGAGGDDRVRPGVEVADQFVQIVPEGVDHRPFQLVGAHPHLLPERPSGVGELLVAGHQPTAPSRSKPASMSSAVQPRDGA